MYSGFGSAIRRRCLDPGWGPAEMDREPGSGNIQPPTSSQVHQHASGAPAVAVESRRLQGIDMDYRWRRDLPVLVAEAGTMGAIGVIRSLGRAGYPVHASRGRPRLWA